MSVFSFGNIVFRKIFLILFLVISFLFYLTSAVSVSAAPGGVSSGNVLWLTPSYGITHSGGLINNWNELAGTNHLTKDGDSNRLTYAENYVNYHAGVFSNDGNDRMMRITSSGFTGPGPRSVFFVGKGNGGVLYTGGTVSGNRANLLWTINSATGGIGNTISGTSDSYVTYIRRDNPALAGRYVIGQVQNLATDELNDYKYAVNGEPLAGQTYRSNNNGNFIPNIPASGYVVGAKRTTQSGVYNTYLTGGIADIIVFNRYLNAAEANKVNSYLAFKHGIHLDQSTPQNYTASDGTIMWSHTKAGAYNRDIFGLGRDEESKFSNRISRSTDTGDILTVSLTNDFTTSNTSRANPVTDMNFMSFSNNGGVLASSPVNLPSGSTERLARAWKVQKTPGFTQSAYLRFTGYNAQWRLILDDDGDFTSGTQDMGPLNASGITTSAIALSDSTYFTLAKVPNGGIEVSETSLDVDENGGTQTFEVRLSSQPNSGTAVTVNVASAHTGEVTVSPATLTFNYSNWETPQFVTVTGVDDGIVQTTQTTVTVSTGVVASDTRFSSKSKQVAVRIIEDDVAELVLDVNGGSLDDVVLFEDIGTAPLDISLSTQPTDDVTITFTSSDTNEVTVSTSSITFTPANWNVKQRVIIAAVDDNYVRDDSAMVTIAVGLDSAEEYLTASNIEIDVSIIDDDVAGITLSKSELSVGENAGTGTFTAVLNSQPLTDVVLNIVSNDTAEATVSPATLTFTTANWDTPQTVTVTGVDDAIQNIDHTTTIVVSVNTGSSDSTYSAVESEDVFVILVNDDNNVPPTDIRLNGGSTLTINENIPSGGTAATISAIDPDYGDSHTFTLGCAVPGADDSSFAISGTNLNVNTAIDYDMKNSYDICIKVEDGAGNEFEKNFTITINEVDDIPPDEPVVSAPTSGATVGNPTTFSGTCEIGATVRIAHADIDGSPAEVTCVDDGSGNGTYSIDVLWSESAESGSKTVVVTQEDAAGNVSEPTNVTVTLDVDNPAAPDVTGPIEGSEVPNPTIVSGTCEVGATVSISNSNLDPNPTTVVCDENGEYTTPVTWEDDSDGNQTLTITQIDAVGNESAPTTIDVIVNTTIPDAPMITAPTADADVTNPTTISGTCEPNAIVKITHPDLVTNPTTTICNGSSEYEVPVSWNADTDGEKTLSITQTNIAGNESPATTLNITLDTVAPNVPTIESPSGSALVSSPTTISGTCEAGATISITGTGIDPDPTTGSCDNDGNYSVEVTWSGSTEDGSQTLYVAQIDAAGNESYSTTLQVDLDASAPDAPEVSSPTSAAAVQSPTTISGTCEVGATVRIAHADLATNPTEVICGNDGTYTASVTWTGADGNKNLSIVQIDGAGNHSTTTTLLLTLDTTAPVAPVIQSANAQMVSGTCEAGSTIYVAHSDLSPNPTIATCDNDGEYSISLTWTGADGDKTLSITQEDAAGNISAASTETVILDTTAPDAPSVGSSTTETVSGTCEVGATVTLTHADIEGSPLTFTCADGTYEFDIDWVDDVEDGMKEVEVTQTDPDGNTSPATQVNILIDTVAPVAPVVGGPAEGAEVSNPTTVSGTCEPGATISISNPNIVPNPTTTVCGGNGTYSTPVVWDENATDGNQTLVITQTDPSGNESVETELDIVLDTTAPTAPTVTTPTNGNPVTGTGEPGATVEVRTSNGSVCTTVVQNDGTYSCTLSPRPTNGATITVTQTDVAGNQSTATVVSGGIVVQSSGLSGGSSGSRPSSSAVSPEVRLSNTNELSVIEFIRQNRNIFSLAHNSNISLPKFILDVLNLPENTNFTVVLSNVQLGLCPAYTFTRELRFGSEGEDVRALQRFLNCAGFSLGTSGPGASGEETQYFVDRTRAAVIRFQEAYAADILTPLNLTLGTGIFSVYSRTKAHSLMAN